MSLDPNPPASWYQPPEPVECCDLFEDEGHDSQACLDEQAENDADNRAEHLREDAMFDRDDGR